MVALRATYDAAGRLTGKLELPLWPDHRSLPDHTSTYNPDNQAQAFNAQPLQHDSDGNLTSVPYSCRILRSGEIRQPVL